MRVQGLQGRRVAAAAVTLAGGVALLTGCSGTPGAAAVVNGEVITSEDVRVAVDQLGSLYEQVNTVNVLSVLVQEPILMDVADEHGIGVSDEEAEVLLNAAAENAGVDAPDEYAPSTLAIAKFAKANSKLQDADDAADISDEIAKRIGDADIEVNPRFGDFDADSLTVLAPATPSWIVVPSDDA